MPDAKTEGMRKTQLGQGGNQSVGELRDMKWPACANHRPSRVETAVRLRASHPAGILNWSKRQTHLDQFAEDDALGALRPVSNDRGDQPQPSGGCPASEGPASDFNRRTEPRTEALASTPSSRPSLLAESHVRSASAAFPRGRPRESESSLWSSPCDRDYAPRFLWSETLVESRTVPPLSTLEKPQKRAYRPPRKS